MATGAILITNGVERVILALGTDAAGDYLSQRTGVQWETSGKE